VPNSKIFLIPRPPALYSSESVSSTLSCTASKKTNRGSLLREGRKRGDPERRRQRHHHRRYPPLPPYSLFSRISIHPPAFSLSLVVYLAFNLPCFPPPPYHRLCIYDAPVASFFLFAYSGTPLCVQTYDASLKPLYSFIDTQLQHT
jgi:hypothetical protein